MEDVECANNTLNPSGSRTVFAKPAHLNVRAATLLKYLLLLSVLLVSLLFYSIYSTAILGKVQDLATISTGSTSKQWKAQRTGTRPSKEAKPHFRRTDLCELTTGSWCGQYWSQEPSPAKPPPRGNKQCLWEGDCNNVGVCDGMKGWCRCPAGWAGDDCTTRMKRPCSQKQNLAGFEPDIQPIDWTMEGNTLRCAQFCDDDIGMCFCNSTWAYGRVSAETPIPGMPPLRRGRTLGLHCQPSQDPWGNPSKFGQLTNDQLFGEKGWCTAAEPALTCPCHLDGFGGPTCDLVHEQFCANQCGGRGDCYLGWCKCDKGWFGHDCAYRMEGTEYTPVDYEPRPWIKPFAVTPAAEDPEPGATRLRPLIYVYEMPTWFNQILLQYRFEKKTCVHRTFNDDNSTAVLEGWVYLIETGLHEALLQSRHRTLDPEEADFFYVPWYTTCIAWPILGATDFPWYRGGGTSHRPQSMTNFMMEAFSWLRSHYPYWDRRNGTDHIIVAVHDEGSCHVPYVWRNAILLTHWGRKDVNHTSRTGYDGDNYSIEGRHAAFEPEGSLIKLKVDQYPCYNASKDLVVPAFHSPHKYGESPIWSGGNGTHKRPIHAFFKGRILENMRYSWGIRQNISKLCKEEDWWEKYKIHVADELPPGWEDKSYSEALTSSVFAFALPGDGWSARFEDSILHGCIPIIIQDEIDLPWASILEYDSFSLRIAEKDIPRIPQILLEISLERTQELQGNLRKVWHRFIWTEYGFYGSLAKAKMLERNASLSFPEDGQLGPFRDDAMHTLLDWLYSKIPDSRK